MSRREPENVANFWFRTLELPPHERVAAAVAIALDHLDELFDLMLCQVLAGRQRGIRRLGAESNGAQLFVFQWLA